MGRKKLEIKKSKNINIRIDEELFEEFKELCSKVNLSQGEFIRSSIIKEINRIKELPNANKLLQ